MESEQREQRMKDSQVKILQINNKVIENSKNRKKILL